MSRKRQGKSGNGSSGNGSSGNGSPGNGSPEPNTPEPNAPIREWWRSGWLWLTVTLVIVFGGIALSWVHWLTVNNYWDRVFDFFRHE